jgi:hypothetical protein
MKSVLERATINYFEGSNYWEVYIDGRRIGDFPTKEEALLFITKLYLTEGENYVRIN